MSTLRWISCSNWFKIAVKNASESATNHLDTNEDAKKNLARCYIKKKRKVSGNWKNMFQVLKERLPIASFRSKAPIFRKEVEIKTFSEKNLREFITCWPTFKY